MISLVQGFIETGGGMMTLSVVDASEPRGTAHP